MTRGFGPGREQTVSTVRFQAAARPLYGQPGTASRGPRPVAARGRRYGRRRGAFGPWLACPWAGKLLPGPGPSSGQGPGPGAATPCQPSSVAGKPRARRGRVRGPRAPFPGQTFRVWIGPPQPLAAPLLACCALSFPSLPRCPQKKPRSVGWVREMSPKCLPTSFNPVESYGFKRYISGTILVAS